MLAKFHQKVIIMLKASLTAVYHFSYRVAEFYLPNSKFRQVFFSVNNVVLQVSEAAGFRTLKKNTQ